jgi:hypothetical protein
LRPIKNVIGGWENVLIYDIDPKENCRVAKRQLPNRILNIGRV